MALDGAPAPALPDVATGRPVSLALHHGSTRKGRPVAAGMFATSHLPEARDYAGLDAGLDPEDEGEVTRLQVTMRNPLVFRGARPRDAQARAAAGGHDGVLVVMPADLRDPSSPLPERIWAILTDPAAARPAGAQGAGELPALPGGYRPDPDAPADGEWVFEDGVAVRWRQDHSELVAEALRRWKGWPSDAQIHMREEREGQPQPSSGSGKQLRAQGAALLWELTYRSRPSSRALHRGAHKAPGGFAAWSERKAVARHWASLNGGEIMTLEPGQARGLRIADYAVSGLDESEREWIIGPQG